MGWDRRLCIAAVSAALAWPALAHADGARMADAIEAVAGHPGLSYLGLVKQAVPDLALDATGHALQGHVAPIPRHIAGYGGLAPDPAVLGAIEDLRFRAGGRPRIALLADFGVADDSTQSFSLLMLFDDGPAPRLLDVVDVGVDKETGFDDHPLIALGPGDDALITASAHSNSNQTYLDRLLILVRGDRFQLIDTLFLFADNGCGWRRDEAPVFDTRPAPANPYPDIRVTVTEALARTGDDCGDYAVPKAYNRSWRGVWRWDVGKGGFVEQLNQLHRLATLNEGRF